MKFNSFHSLYLILPCFNCWPKITTLKPQLSPVDDLAMAIENRGPQVEAVAIIFLTLSWITVSLRCYVKIFMTRLLRIDDWLAMLSLVRLLPILALE